MAAINVFSKHLQWLNWEDTAKIAKCIGFNGLDLTVRKGGHVEPENVEYDLPKVVEICNNEGLSVDMICTNIQSVSNPSTEKILKTACELGVNYYRMDWYSYDLNISLKENLKDIKVKLSDLAEMNEKHGIKGSYQNHDGTWFGASVWDLAMILEQINSEWIGCQYDILNATLEGINSWQHSFEYIAPYIHTIDLKDAYWKSDYGRPTLKYSPIGSGVVEWEKFIQLMKKMDINVPFSFHFEYDLGGAETGENNITVSPDKVLKSMGSDLDYFKNNVDLFW